MMLDVEELNSKGKMKIKQEKEAQFQRALTSRVFLPGK